MNKKTTFAILGASAAAFAAGMLLRPILFSEQSDAHAGHSTDTAAADTDSADPTTWTCSMHPQIQQPDPGDCPICGMDLIPLESDSGDEGPRVMSMSESSRALAEIQTTEVKQDFPEAEIRLVGKLDYDETREKSLSSRFPARIDELYVNFTGIRVKQGEHLAKVYSPDLLAAQRELLSAYRANPESSITRAAREKLRLWDLLPEQIDAIIEGGEAKDHFVLQAPIGGIVVAKKVKEGDYVKTGEPLFRIVDLSVLWAYLDAYESDLPWLRFGQDVAFSVESFPGETFEGQIAFIEPEVNRKTRTVRVRVNVPNTDGKLKPGMFARGVVASRLDQNGKVYAPEFAGKWISPMHPEIVKDTPGECDVCGMDLVPAEELGYVENTNGVAPLTIPASAVLRTGKRAVVYVEKPNAERPTFEGREVVLGPRAGEQFIVVEGLEAGERVVTQGAFKIDSALQIQAKPSMMNPDAADANSGQPKAASIDIPVAQAATLLPAYLAMQSALAADDLEQAKAQAKALMDITGHSGELPDLLHVMLDTKDLESLRKPHFETLSNTLIAAVEKDPAAMPENLIVMHCPMVYGETGADWLQDSEPLLNPYFGSMMLKCGEVKTRFSPPTEAVPPKNEKLLELDTTTAAAILPGYLKLQSAMAADDHAGAKAALKAVMEITGHTGLLPDLIHKMLEAGDLEGIRRPHFETLSNALIAAVKKEPSAMPPGLMVMHCPMVYGETGADWLQDSEPLLNPYFGAMMLKCGYLKEDISQEKSGHEGHAH